MNLNFLLMKLKKIDRLKKSLLRVHEEIKELKNNKCISLRPSSSRRGRSMDRKGRKNSKRVNSVGGCTRRDHS